LLKSPETIFLFWLLMSPLVQTHLNIAGHGLPNITLDRVVLLSLAAVGLAAAVSSKRASSLTDHRRVLLFLLLGAYVAAEFLGYWRGVWRLNTSLQFYLDSVLLPGIAFVSALTFTLRDGLRFVNRLLGVVVWVGVLSVGLEVLRRYAGIERFLYPGGRPFIWDDVEGTRAAGELGNPAIFGAVITLSLAVVLVRGWPRSSVLLQWIIIAACTWGAFLSYTRSVWLSFVLVILLFVALGGHSLGRLALASVALLLLGTSTLLTASASLSAFIVRLSNSSTIQLRDTLLSESWNQFTLNPLAGAGAGWFDSVHYRFQTNSYTGSIVPVGFPAHNSIVLMLADRGLVAFVPYVCILGYVLLASVRLYRHALKATQRAVYVYWSAAAIYLVTAYTIEVDFFPYFIAVFWTLMGMVIGLGWRTTQDLRQEKPALRAESVHARVG